MGDLQVLPGRWLTDQCNRGRLDCFFCSYMADEQFALDYEPDSFFRVCRVCSDRRQFRSVFK